MAETVDLTPERLDAIEGHVAAGHRYHGDVVILPCDEVAALVQAARERRALGVAARDVAYWAEQAEGIMDESANSLRDQDGNASGDDLLQAWALLASAIDNLKQLTGSPAKPATEVQRG